MEKSYNTSLAYRIDWADLDLFGHVNNVAFFRYIQAARVDYCESIGLTSVNEAGKLSFMVASSSCKFKRPLYFPGNVTILTRVEYIKNTSMLLQHLIQNAGGEVVAEAEDVIVLFDHHAGEKRVIDGDLKKAIASRELREM